LAVIEHSATRSRRATRREPQSACIAYPAIRPATGRSSRVSRSSISETGQQPSFECSLKIAWELTSSDPARRETLYYGGVTGTTLLNDVSRWDGRVLRFCGRGGTVRGRARCNRFRCRPSRTPRSIAIHCQKNGNCDSSDNGSQWTQHARRCRSARQVNSCFTRLAPMEKVRRL